MAKKQSTTTTISSHKDKAKKKRPGIHAKTKTAGSKKSKNYLKTYRGQGH
jgi:hypothetical protein